MTVSRFNRSITSRRPVVAAAFALVMVVLSSGAPAAAEDGSVVLKSFRSPVAIVRADGRAVTASERARLRSGDTIKVGAGGHAYVEFSTGNVGRIGENTTVRLDVVEEGAEREGGALFGSYGNGRYVLYLVEGQILPALDRFRGRSMEVGTPVATAGVRGTVFLATVVRREAEAEGDGERGGEGAEVYDVGFDVFSGELAVQDNRAQGQWVSVPAGFSFQVQGVRVPPGGFSGGQQGGPGGGRQGGPGGGQQGGPGGGRQGGPGGSRQGGPGEGPQGGQMQGGQMQGGQMQGGQMQGGGLQPGASLQPMPLFGGRGGIPGGPGGGPQGGSQGSPQGGRMQGNRMGGPGGMTAPPAMMNRPSGVMMPPPTQTDRIGDVQTGTVTTTR